MISVRTQTGSVASESPAIHPVLRKLILLCLLFLATPARAADFAYTAADGQITITGYTGTSGAVVIPAALEGLPVTKIGDSAFYGIYNLTSVVIPAGVASIGEGAFMACQNLTSVALPPGLTALPAKLFRGCQNLTQISIPPGVTSIGASAFDSCMALPTISLPPGLTGIGDYAFNCCYQLESIALPPSLVTIGNRAFSLCSSLTGLTLPAGVSQIGAGIIAGSTKLSAITVEGASLHFRTLDGVLYDNSMTKILAVPCGKTGSFTIPDGVTTIGPMAFSGCTGLTDVTISPSVTQIMDEAFTSCALLEVMTIPASVTSIGKSVFQYCSNLTALVFMGNAPAVSPYAFASTRSDLTSYYHQGATGFLFWWPSLLAELAANREILVKGPAGEILATGSAATDFGYLMSGASTSKTYTLLNIGATPLTGLEIHIDGDGASDFGNSTLSKSSLPPGGRTSFTVSFTGHTGGIKTAALHLLSNDADESPFDVQLSGICTPDPVPEITVTRNGTSLNSGVGTSDMGNVYLGSFGTADFTITNPGTGHMLIPGIVVDGADASDFTVYGALPPAILPGGSFTFSVRFVPSTTGIRTASLHIPSNDPDEASFDISITGTGIMSPNPEIAVFPASGSALKDGSSLVSFDSVMEGTRSTAQTFTITNHGLKTLQNIYLSTSGTDALEFIVSPLNRYTLEPGASIEFTILSAPKDTGGNTATLQIYSNDSDENPFDIQLAGSGSQKPHAPEIDLWLQGTRAVSTGDSVGFGTSELQIPVTKTFIIYNRGSAELADLSATLDGAGATDFSVTPLSSTVLGAGLSREIQVSFSPRSTGIKSAVLHITSNDSDESAIDVNLSGEGTAFTHPEIVVTSGTELTDGVSTLSFSPVLAGFTNSISFFIKNQGDASLRNISITIDGPGAEAFVSRSLTKTTLSPESLLYGMVTFKPSKGGIHEATLHILSDDADESSFDIQLTGTAIPNAPEIDVQQPGGYSLTDGSSVCAFGPAALKTTVTKVFTIRNVGGRDISKILVKKDGPNANDFIVKQPVGTIMAPDTWMRFKVTFKPTAKGIRRATIHIRSNDADESPFDIDLTGKGTAPASARESLATVIPGLSATEGLNQDASISRMKIGGKSYRTITLRKLPGEEIDESAVEVSSNLIDWFSGPRHTTVVIDDARQLIVRDNTHATPETKRYIRLKSPPTGRVPRRGARTP